MSQTKEQKLKLNKWICALTAALLTILYGCAVYMLCGRMQLCYDESAMQALISGDMSGVPSAYPVFINYVVSALICSLYSVCPGIGWMGTILLFSMLFSLWALIYRIMTWGMTRRHWGYPMIGLCAIISVFIYHFLFYGHLVHIEYTVCAAVPAIVLILYIISPVSLDVADTLITAVLVFLCMGLRFSIFKEMLPFLVVAVAYRVFRRGIVRRELPIYILWAVVVCGLYVGNAVGYSGEYSELKSINHYRAGIQDYGGLPDYDGHEDVYASLDMDRQDYLEMKMSWGMSDHLDSDTLKTLYLQKQSELDENISYRLKNALELAKGLLTEDYSVAFWLTELLLCVGALTVVCAAGDRWQKLYLIGNILLVFGELGYLCLKGRIPVRVSLPLVSVLCIINLVFIFETLMSADEHAYEKLNLRQIIILTCLLFGLMVGNIFVTAHALYREYKEEDAALLSLEKALMADDANTYFCAGFDEELDIRKSHRRNFYKLSGWISETDEWQQAMKGEYTDVWEAIASRDDLRFMISDEHVEIMTAGLQARGMDALPVESHIDVDGMSYTVWTFR